MLESFAARWPLPCRSGTQDNELCAHPTYDPLTSPAWSCLWQMPSELLFWLELTQSERQPLA